MNEQRTNVARLLRRPLLRAASDAGKPLQTLAAWWVGGEVTHRIAKPGSAPFESRPPVESLARTIHERRTNVATVAVAALLAFAPMQASAGGYVAPVIPRIITPADIAPPPTAGAGNNWWLIGVPIVICLLVCFGSDDDGGRTIVEPPRPPEPPVEPPAPVPLPAGAVLALTGLGALAALRRRKGK